MVIQPKTRFPYPNGIHYEKTSDVCETSDVWKIYKFL